MTVFSEVLREAEAREGAGWLEAHSSRLLDSYRHWTGEALWPGAVEEGPCAEALFHAPVVVLSSRADEDQTLNYGNAAALRLWGMEWEVLTRLPSRFTAEPVERAAREAFLRRVREQGVIRDYSGVRVAADGRRFRIERAVVWNVVDAAGSYHGQAAAFRDWMPIGD
jgi:PAS domain-containing protein